MELEDGIHKSRPKGGWFEVEPEPESTLAPQRGKRARWWPILIVVLMVVILSGGVLVSTRFGRSTSTGKQAIHSTWCVSSGVGKTNPMKTMWQKRG